MGVDFLICEVCNRTFPDCGFYHRCAGCGCNFCKGCGDGYVFESDDADTEDARTDPISCPVCTLKVVSDSELLDHAIALLRTTREALTDDYREWKKKQ